MKIGFIGLGNMGGPMVANLAKAGHQVHAFDMSQAAIGKAVAAGAAAGPTAVRLEAMQASRYDNGALIEWQTGYEADNLGFNVYREISGRRELVNTELLAGSALVTGRAAMLAGRRYALWDGSVNQHSEISYYIEDLDLNGKTRSSM